MIGVAILTTTSRTQDNDEVMQGELRFEVHDVPHHSAEVS